MTTFDAVYRGGALHPLTPLALAEGAAVRVTVEEAATPAAVGQSAYEILTAITTRSVPPARPGAVPDDGSVNHDKYLYGAPGDRGDVR